MIGVAASSASQGAILIAGVAGLVAGAMSMAVGEYVSVSSQLDAEQADIKLEKRELSGQPQAELQELAMIYVKRGVDQELAMKVAEQLARMIGSVHTCSMSFESIMHFSRGRCKQPGYRLRALRLFAMVPIIGLLIVPSAFGIPAIVVFSLASLAVLVRLAVISVAPLGRAALRVTIGGALAMAVTAVIGKILGVSVG